VKLKGLREVFDKKKYKRVNELY